MTNINLDGNSSSSLSVDKLEADRRRLLMARMMSMYVGLLLLLFAALILYGVYKYVVEYMPKETTFY